MITLLEGRSRRADYLVGVNLSSKEESRALLKFCHERDIFPRAGYQGCGLFPAVAVVDFGFQELFIDTGCYTSSVLVYYRKHLLYTHYYEHLKDFFDWAIKFASQKPCVFFLPTVGRKIPSDIECCFGVPQSDLEHFAERSRDRALDGLFINGEWPLVKTDYAPCFVNHCQDFRQGAFAPLPIEKNLNFIKEWPQFRYKTRQCALDIASAQRAKLNSTCYFLRDKGRIVSLIELKTYSPKDYPTAYHHHGHPDIIIDYHSNGVEKEREALGFLLHSLVSFGFSVKHENTDLFELDVDASHSLSESKILHIRLVINRSCLLGGLRNATIFNLENALRNYLGNSTSFNNEFSDHEYIEKALRLAESHNLGAEVIDEIRLAPFRSNMHVLRSMVAKPENAGDYSKYDFWGYR